MTTLCEHPHQCAPNERRNVGPRHSELGLTEIISRYGDRLRIPRFRDQLRELIACEQLLDEYLDEQDRLGKNQVRRFVQEHLCITDDSDINALAQLFWLYLEDRELFLRFFGEAETN